ncbi:MAG: hypothetical protein GXP05_04215 [Alphaproteobacteria bacterium]|nr:hypothetical protein [Alphaproteobacteria bacterium]
MAPDILLLDSITDARADARGRLVVCGSHGGLFPAAVAARAQVRAVLFNDAGIGLDRAGVVGVVALESVGMAAVALDCHSCRIGSADDALARGIVSVVNAVAVDLGVTAGMTAEIALDLLGKAAPPSGQLATISEARKSIVFGPNNLRIQLLDSASLVNDSDRGEIVITGSHGGLIGGDALRALKADARLAVFNDAGFGMDDCGVTRLAALDARDIAALTVASETARIGDAASALESGVISRVNRAAGAMGATVGVRLNRYLIPRG